jgi:hypothetical protein
MLAPNAKECSLTFTPLIIIYNLFWKVETILRKFC